MALNITAYTTVINYTTHNHQNYHYSSSNHRCWVPRHTLGVHWTGMLALHHCHPHHHAQRNVWSTVLTTNCHHRVHTLLTRMSSLQSQ